jgi:hypothetical protein
MSTRVLRKILRNSSFLRTCATSNTLFTATPVLRRSFVPCINIVQQKRNYTRHGVEKQGLLDLWKNELKKQLREDKDLQQNLEDIKKSKTVEVGGQAVDIGKSFADKAAPHLQATGEVLKKGGEALLDGASIIANSAPVTKVTEAVTDLTGRLAQQTFIKYVVDDLTEEHREQRTLRYNFRSDYGRKDDLKNGIQYNPYTGAFEKIDEVQANTIEKGVVIATKKKREMGVVRRGIDNVVTTLDGSNNILVKGTKNLFQSIGTVSDVLVDKVLKPSEESQVLTTFKERDPTFGLQLFMKNVEFIIMPEVLGAYFNDDVPTLRRYVTDQCYRGSFYPRIHARQHDKTHFETKILDIRDVTLLSARFDGDEPMLVLGCQVQFIYHIKDEKDSTIEGGPNDIRLESQIWAFRQDLSGDTRDWEVAEVAFGFDSVRIV